ncbi:MULTISPECIES: hypothetical protein [unclassified Micromonospora]|uniref:hypothetical protein n=1 Tax=unclassified Micromonospora TaxID=2617518 RepID=UPI003332FD45
MTDQSTWPAHLRDNAPSQQCGRCGRFTWSPSKFGAECRMPQPDGYPCGGRFEPPGILLDIYAARVGAPVPTDTVTPLPEEYAWAGKGKVRLTEPSFDPTGDLLTRSTVRVPQLLIVWEFHLEGWYDNETVHTIVGHAVGSDGVPVRMVAPRVGRIEHELHRGLITSTIDLHRAQPAGGGLITWYWPAQ